MTDRTGATLVRCEKCWILHEPLDPCPTPKVEAATDEAIAAHRERMCDMEIEDLVPEDQEYLRLIARIDAQAEQIEARNADLRASEEDNEAALTRIKEFEAVSREASEMIRSGAMRPQAIAEFIEGATAKPSGTRLSQPAESGERVIDAD